MYQTWENVSGFLVTTDPDEIDLDVLFHYLHNIAYWCKGIPNDIVSKSLENSLNFSLISPDKKFVGFGRVITDFATFAYLGDVFVLDNYQGRGLSAVAENLNKVKQTYTFYQS